MPSNLARKTAIITGPSSGIGRAIAAGRCGRGDLTQRYPSRSG
ncbi:hypothetical protein [Laspinema palackyanum]